MEEYGTIIGVCGLMGVGKNWVADYIQAELHDAHQFTMIMAFADELKHTVMAKYNLTYSDVFTVKNSETRRLLQHEGTEVGRAGDPLIWIKKLSGWVDIYMARGVRRFIIADVRFPNEAEWIKSRRGVLFHVSAPDRNANYKRDKGISDVGHASESYDAHLHDIADFHIRNDINISNRKVSDNILQCIQIMVEHRNIELSAGPDSPKITLVADSDGDDGD